MKSTKIVTFCCTSVVGRPSSEADTSAALSGSDSGKWTLQGSFASGASGGTNLSGGGVWGRVGGVRANMPETAG